MKKLAILFVLFFVFSSGVNAYDLTNNDRQNLDKFEKIVYNVFDKKPQKAYVLQYNASRLLEKLDRDSKNYALIVEVLRLTNKYISEYIENTQTDNSGEEDNYHEQWNSSTWSQTDDDTGDSSQEQNDDYTKPTYESTTSDLEILSWNDYKTMSSFTLEPKLDSVYLKNIYMQNIWSLQHMWPIIDELYLVDDNNKILSNWYVIDDYIYFDLFWEILLEKKELYKIYVVAKLWQADNKMETGEIIFDFSTPSDALQGTSNGIRAISYSNWSYIASEAQINDKIETFVSYNSTMVSNLDFVPWYRQAMKFRVNNNSKENLSLDSFEFWIFWSFMNNLDPNTKFILKVDWSNQIFGEANLSDLSNWYLTINHTWNSFDFISRQTYTDYVLEIEHIWNPDWSREVRLQNIVIWDWFWWTIDNLDDYSNTWLPGDYYNYRY